MSEIGVGVGQEFTTRPQLTGSFGMVSSTHWAASGAGMRMLEAGGNAFDAAVAAGLVLQVVQPNLCGPGGDLPIILWDAHVGQVEVLCAQGVAPRQATVAAFLDRGLSSIPGTGLLAPCVPGAMDGWLRLLLEKGRLRLREVLQPALEYAAHGVPVTPAIHAAIASVARLMSEHWPASAAVYLVDGAAPAVGTRLRNLALASTYERLLSEAEAVGPVRDAQIESARSAFRQGFVLDAVAAFLASAEAIDSTGRRHRALLTADDIVAWQSTWESPLSVAFGDVTVCKAGPWSQGPVLLQQLQLLAGNDLASTDRFGADYVHTVLEATKLSYADREAWYADPLFEDVPIDALLSAEYAGERRQLIGADASTELRPGSPAGRRPHLPARRPPTEPTGPGVGEPTVRVDGNPAPHRGDTCHVDVVDRFGNMIAATPSGGWLQSSPVIPELGYPLGTRLQMFELDDRSMNRLVPGKRPRTTLSPSLALRDGAPWLAFGTPGGDQQDQWTLQFLLNVAMFGDDLQLAVDRPVFHSAHFPSSFAPREAHPARAFMESRFPPDTMDELRRRGHDVITTGPWSLTRLCAAGVDREGFLIAAANPRGMEGYAVGR